MDSIGYEEQVMAEAAQKLDPVQKKSNVVENMKMKSGFEGYETELGQAFSVVLKQLGNHAGYAHELNDPLVKAHLMAIQFAKVNGTIADYVAYDVETMAPINARMKNVIDKTGEKEVALVGLFDRTACHYALALDSGGKGNTRTWTSPFKTVLDAAQRIGQFEGLTEEYIHENWTKPRLIGYAEAMGVKITISDLDENRQITCELVED
jgi:hypothetical protein